MVRSLIARFSRAGCVAIMLIAHVYGKRENKCQDCDSASNASPQSPQGYLTIGNRTHLLMWAAVPTSAVFVWLVAFVSSKCHHVRSGRSRHLRVNRRINQRLQSGRVPTLDLSKVQTCDSDKYHKSAGGRGSSVLSAHGVHVRVVKSKHHANTQEFHESRERISAVEERRASLSRAGQAFADNDGSASTTSGLAATSTFFTELGEKVSKYDGKPRDLGTSSETVLQAHVPLLRLDALNAKRCSQDDDGDSSSTSVGSAKLSPGDSLTSDLNEESQALGSVCPMEDLWTARPFADQGFAPPTSDLESNKVSCCSGTCQLSWATLVCTWFLTSKEHGGDTMQK